MASTDWKIPQELRPDPDDYGFDLDRTLQSVVGVTTSVPADAFTAPVLGTERAGSGAVIRDGLVLTIGYLITEAETVWLTSADGRAIPGHPLALDQETGFGLVQALGRLNLPPFDLGDPAAMTGGEPCVLAAAGGRHHAIETTVVGRQEFAGYWEYVLDDAIFTAPAHPFWGGAALIGDDGKLLGVGSLVVQQSDEDGDRLDMNMVVPVDRLTPVLDDLAMYGGTDKPPRPWLGIYAAEDGDTIAVGSLATGGPAERAGIRKGDRIVGVRGEPVSSLAGLWRKIWATGVAGAIVTLQVERAGNRIEVPIASASRTSFLRAPRLH